jgi:hypothetical protein
LPCVALVTANKNDPNLSKNPYAFYVDPNAGGVDVDLIGGGNPHINIRYIANINRPLQTSNEYLDWKVMEPGCNNNVDTDILNAGGAASSGIVGTVMTVTKEFILNTKNIYKDPDLLFSPYSGGPLKSGDNKNHFVFRFCVRTDLIIKDRGIAKSVSYDESNFSIDIELTGSLQRFDLKLEEDVQQQKTTTKINKFDVVAYQCDDFGGLITASQLPPNSWVQLCIRSDSNAVEVTRVQSMTFSQNNKVISSPVVNYNPDFITKTPTNVVSGTWGDVAIVRTQLIPDFFDGLVTSMLPVDVTGNVEVKFKDRRNLIRSLQVQENNSNVVPDLQTYEGNFTVTTDGASAASSSLSWLMVLVCAMMQFLI